MGSSILGLRAMEVVFCTIVRQSSDSMSTVSPSASLHDSSTVSFLSDHGMHRYIISLVGKETS